jgi:Flp pilus assembly protein TadG
MSIDPIRRLVARLAGHRSGATAGIFAVLTPVTIAGLTLAVDAGYQRMLHARMQAAVDGAALAGVMEIEQGRNPVPRITNHVAASLPSSFGQVTMGADVTTGVYDETTGFVPGASADMNAVRVNGVRSPARGNVAEQFFASFFGATAGTIAVTAVAARPVNVFYQPPERQDLAPEAGDFNEMYAYCFDTLGTGPVETRRTQMTLISNNMPANQNIVTISGGLIPANPANPLPWPRCNQRGQTLSFRMRNIRHVKSNPGLWANPGLRIDGRTPGRPEFNYFTDTTLTNNVENWNLPVNILETVLCDTVQQCTPGAPGTRIPSGRNRQNTRRIERNPCEPGKFMYFGFEDRPPGQPGASASWLDPAWTDADYDDIRIYMRCPASGRLGDALPRLVG